MPTVRRLGPGDEAVASALFEVMAAVFEDEEAWGPSPDAGPLLRRQDFWALAAMEGDVVVGGLTAHALPMTRDRSTELFIYDLAVAREHQRRGIGRALVATLRSLGQQAGITTVFVPADDEDTHALDFYRAIGGVPSPVTFFTFSS